MMIWKQFDKPQHTICIFIGAYFVYINVLTIRRKSNTQCNVKILPGAISSFDDVQSQLAKLKKTCKILNRIVMEVMKEICVPK